MIITVIATEDINPGDRIYVSQGFVRLAHIGADREAGLALNPLNKGAIGKYNTDTRELRRAPVQMR